MSIVSDWNEGLEAVFLLKTVRELKGNHSAFTLAIANAETATAAREAGADLVLSRPLVPDEVKYALADLRFISCPDEVLVAPAGSSPGSRDLKPDLAMRLSIPAGAQKTGL